MRILIIRTDRLGDVILTTPMATAIKRLYPDYEVSFLVSSPYDELLRFHPHIDNVFRYENGFFKRAKESFDAAILVHPKRKIAFELFTSGIKIRIGNGFKLYSFLFNRWVFQRRRVGGKHEIEYNLELLKPLGIYVDSKIPPEFNIPDSIVDKIRKNYEKYFSSINICIHPLKTTSSLKWDLDNFKSLVRIIQGRLDDVSVFVTSSKEEAKFLRDFKDIIKRGLLIYNLKLTELAALYSLCDIMIANSTGPLHLAASVGIDTIGLFPLSKAQHLRRWGAYGKGLNINLKPPFKDCDRCIEDRCPYYNCLNHITPEEVFFNVYSILKHREKI